MKARSHYKTHMMIKALAEIDAPEVSTDRQATMLIALINKNLTLDSLAAMLTLIFVYLMALISPIKTLCLSLPKTPVFPSKSIKAVQFLSFT